LIPVVCDASVVVRWFDTSIGAVPDHCRTLLRERIAGRCRLAVLDLTLYEVGNALLRDVGATPEHCAVVLDALPRVAEVLRPDPIVLRDAARFAAEDRLTIYDAAYVAQAFDRGYVLATEDREILRAGLGVNAETALWLSDDGVR
jgi:predicted nucleic acid-binding protein